MKRTPAAVDFSDIERALSDLLQFGLAAGIAADQMKREVRNMIACLQDNIAVVDTAHGLRLEVRLGGLLDNRVKLVRGDR